jgi:hypothetical protein
MKESGTVPAPRSPGGGTGKIAIDRRHNQVHRLPWAAIASFFDCPPSRPSFRTTRRSMTSLLRSSLRAALPLLLLGAVLAAPALAQERGNEEARASPNAAVSQTIGTTEVRLTYGRPQVKGRTIFGDDGLVPYGEVWRTGANEATTISFSSDVTVQGESLAAGTYSLYTIPGPESWTIIFNDTAEQWGTNYDNSEDVLRVDATPASAPSREMMTFLFTDVTNTSGTCVLHWADVRVPFEIEVAGE